MIQLLSRKIHGYAKLVLHLLCIYNAFQAIFLIVKLFMNLKLMIHSSIWLPHFIYFIFGLLDVNSVYFHLAFVDIYLTSDVGQFQTTVLAKSTGHFNEFQSM